MSDQLELLCQRELGVDLFESVGIVIVYRQLSLCGRIQHLRRRLSLNQIRAIGWRYQPNHCHRRIYILCLSSHHKGPQRRHHSSCTHVDSNVNGYNAYRERANDQRTSAQIERTSVRSFSYTSRSRLFVGDGRRSSLTSCNIGRIRWSCDRALIGLGLVRAVWSFSGTGRQV